MERRKNSLKFTRRGRLESLQLAAKLEHEISETIDSKLDKKLISSFDEHGTSDIEQNEVLSEGKKLVIHYLRNEIHQQHDLHEYDKNRCNITVNKTIKQINSFQRELDNRHLEETEHQTIKQTKGMGMSM